jgi:4-oxalocrotonate tautomerase family enzyme
MPVINVTVSKLSKAQKKNLIRLLTEASVKVTGVPAEFHTVLINELDDDAIGSGGLTIEDIKGGQ